MSSLHTDCKVPGAHVASGAPAACRAAAKNRTVTGTGAGYPRYLYEG